MVTASHNPAGWNGVKLSRAYSSTLVRSELEEMYDIITKDDFVEGIGSIDTFDIFSDYKADLLGKISIVGAPKVVVNTGNGTAGAFAPDILRSGGCTVVELNTKLDPTYPHYTPNPAEVEMMEDTGRVVREHAAEVGVAIDADGDRLGITDENGEIIWPDRFMILLARQVLESHPGAKIVFDVKCSNALPEDIVAHGGVPIMWKTGHSYIKQKLQEEQAALGGEMSGHIFVTEDYYGFDDAIFAALKIVEYMSRQPKPLSGIIADTPYYVSTPTYGVEVHDSEGTSADVLKYRIVDELTNDFKNEYDDVIDINGARVTLGNGSWGLIRASSNLPTLVLRFEAKNQMDLDSIVSIFRNKISRYPNVSSEWKTQ